jgi:chromosome segregation ATPase
MNDEVTTKELPDDPLRLILARLDSIDARLTRVETQLDSIDARLTSVEKRFLVLEEKVESHLVETRPIWERVLVELEDMNKRIGLIEQENVDFRELFRYTFSDMNRVQSKFNHRLEKLKNLFPSQQ